MSIPTSVLAELLQALPHPRSQIYFKSSLVALSHAIEDHVLAGSEPPLVIASFQRERFYHQEVHRYRRIAKKTNQLYVLAAPETDFKNNSGAYETVAFEPTDGLAEEWHLVVIGQQYATSVLCRERPALTAESAPLEMDSTRRFEAVWSSDWQVSCKAAELLLERILVYRPELAQKVEQARTQYLQALPNESEETGDEENLLRQDSQTSNPEPFVQRLLTYLQASQYKLLKTYRTIAAKEEKERLLRSMTVAIRRSLNPEEVLQVAVQELGRALGACRCLVYRCKETDESATITHEFLGSDVSSLQGQTWSLQNNSLFQEVIQQREFLYVEDTLSDARINDQSLRSRVQRFSIVSWLLVPVLYQDRLLGMVELHRCSSTLPEWTKEKVALVDAIATQIGVALIQAEAYANLEDLNEQLEALERTCSNLVAITGHELRTPLSTIQVCLESLASEPDMSPELRQVMLNTALTDSERLRKLVQDFLTLSRLESGRVEWHPEPLSLRECIDLAISNISAHKSDTQMPQIKTSVSTDLPLVQVDGEWLVEVLAKLLDNACKFTSSEGEITIQAQNHGTQMLEVTIADTGRGIEPSRLETVFDLFYQEEGALRRTTGGTGLGLAICRQIVNHWGGEIRAESTGKDDGSQFHFTVPIVRESSGAKALEADGQSPATLATRRGRRKTSK